MGTVFPISSATKQTPTPTPTTTSSGDNAQVTENMFLQLLVAQMKYQDPMNPVDSTQFLTQTAQFTELETLQKIETEQSAQQSASQMLAASSMVGRQVSYSLALNGNAATPVGTSVVSIRGTLPKDADAGAKAQTATTVYTASGMKVPLTLDFTKTDTGWTLQASSSGLALGAPLPITFDASGDRTSTDLSIPSSALDGIVGTSGDWPATGITLGFGDSSDPTRLQLASGPSTVDVAEQNGNDGTSATGVVTGVHVTSSGPQLVIGGQDSPYTSVTDIN